MHWLLSVAMMLSAVGVFGEMLARRSVVVGMGKSLSVVLQGAWLVKIASIEFEGELGGGVRWVRLGGRVGGGWGTCSLIMGAGSVVRMGV